jgi:hypothetical protein
MGGLPKLHKILTQSAFDDLRSGVSQNAIISDPGDLETEGRRSSEAPLRRKRPGSGLFQPIEVALVPASKS